MLVENGHGEPEMRKGTLGRILAESGDEGTFGQIVVGALAIYLGELPWRDDKHDLSCLPPAMPLPNQQVPPAITYLLKYIYSEAHKKKNYRFIGVLNDDGSIGPMPDGRTAAEIHAANLVGDILKGYAAQVEGCGAPGRAIVTFSKGTPFKSFTAASPTALVPITLAQDQKGVSSSGDALAAFEAELAGEDLALTISWV